MFVLQFVKNAKVVIDYSENYSLFDGIEQLKKWNKNAISKNSKFIMQYKIYDTVKNEVVLVDQLALGTDYMIDFFKLTRTRLKQLYSDQDLSNILELLDSMEAQYQSEKDEYYASASSEAAEDEVQQVENTEESPKKKRIKKIKPNKKKEKSSSKEENQQLKELIAIIKELPKSLQGLFVAGLVGILLSISLSIGIYIVASSEYVPTYEELIDSGQYLSALDAYPDNYYEIEQALVALGDEGISLLEDFISIKDDYPQAELDLAYLRKEYPDVVQLASYADTEQRKAQVIVAYIHLGEYAKAVSLNNVVSSKEYNQLIDQVYFNLIVNHLNQNDYEAASTLQGYANNSVINDYIESVVKLSEEIESLSLKEQETFLGDKKLSDLKSERTDLLNQDIFSPSKHLNWTKVLLSSAAAITIGVVIAHRWRESRMPNSKITDYYDLITNNLYIEALRLYPQKYPEIERFIFQLGENGIPYLEEFIDKKKTYKQAQFDLAYLRKEYDKVIKLEKYADTDGRKTQLAISYIQVGNIDLANHINQILQVPEIAYYLNEQYYSMTVAALKNDDFSSAQKYQEASANSDISYLLETIRLIDVKIKKLEKQAIDSPEKKSLAQRGIKELLEMRAYSLALE